MFVLVVLKHIAHKMANKNNFVSQKAFINFQKLQPKTNQTKNSTNHKIMENLQQFDPKTPKNDLLTLN